MQINIDMQPVVLHEKIMSHQDCQTLIDYMKIPGDRYDERPDVISKHPLWDKTEWPQHIAEKALDQILPSRYIVDEITIMQSKIGLKPHCDWIGHDTVIVALDADPVAHTVFFKNRIPKRPVASHPAAFLTKTPWSPYQYELPDKHGTLVKINDIRDLYKEAKESPHTLNNFDVDEQFLQMLEHLIKKRSQPRLDHDKQTDDTGYVQTTPRITDYAKWVTDYDPNSKFPADVHEKYLTHVQIEDLHGLSVDKNFEWNKGDIMHFNGSQIHSASGVHNQKTFMTVFLHYAN